jgi:LmbE family N-acetylglucosaminyl deacetylase
MSAVETGDTAPHEWAEAVTAREVPVFELDRYRSVLVVAAHPDDETLGVGGLVAAMHRNGAQVSVAVATDGEAAFPGQDSRRRSELAITRHRELRRALDAQGMADVEIRWAGLPDSALAEHTPELTKWLEPLCAGRDLCLAPWALDPHPDHRAAGTAARAATPAEIEVWWYPIWMRPWMRAEGLDIPWRHATRHVLTDENRAVKRAGINEFVSQLQPGPSGEDPILPPDIVSHFDGDTELLFRAFTAATTPVARFASLYRVDDDPWRTRTDHYERRKRAVTLASLPHAHYRRGLDAGCGSGALTEALSRVCGELVAVDAVSEAVSATQRAVADHRNTTVKTARLPDEFPAGPFDLLVFSEILYYFDDPDLGRTLDAAAAALEPGGDLVAVDWRPAAGDAPRDAEDAHRALLRHDDWTQIVEHREPEFLLHVVRRR